MALQVGKCKLCLEIKPLLNKSHILSEFLYKEGGFYDEKHQMIKVDVEELKNSNPKKNKLNLGIYEAGILCQNCDGVIIKTYEDYAREILFAKKMSEKIKPQIKTYQISSNEIKHSVCENVDYKKFKLFLISLIWRMNISSQPSFIEVNLGMHEEEMRKMLLEGDPKEFEIYPTAILTWIKDKTFSKDIFLPPRKLKKNGNTFYSLPIGGLVYLFFITSGNLWLSIRNCAVNTNNILKILHLPDRFVHEILKSYQKK